MKAMMTETNSQTMMHLQTVTLMMTSKTIQTMMHLLTVTLMMTSLSTTHAVSSSLLIHSHMCMMFRLSLHMPLMMMTAMLFPHCRLSTSRLAPTLLTSAHWTVISTTLLALETR
jgi:hypothetical protein